MTDKSAAKAKTPGAHTELRRQDKARDKTEVERDEAATPLKPRTPVDRVPSDGDEDDLFNDMPV
jgi:hypothetical protein